MDPPSPISVGLARELHRVYLYFQNNLAANKEPQLAEISRVYRDKVSLATSSPASPLDHQCPRHISRILSMWNLFEIYSLADPTTISRYAMVEELVKWRNCYFPFDLSLVQTATSIDLAAVWTLFGRCILTRQYDKACLLVQDLLSLERTAKSAHEQWSLEFRRNLLLIESICEQLLAFPPPALRHARLAEWMEITRSVALRELASISPVQVKNVPIQLQAILEVLCGNCANASLFTNEWPDLLIGHLFYTGDKFDLAGFLTPLLTATTTNTTTTNTTTTNITTTTASLQSSPSDLIIVLERMMMNCLLGEINPFVQDLSLLPLWVKAHFGNLLLFVGWVDEESSENWIIEYQAMVEQTFADLWNISLDYLSCCPSRGKGLLEDKARQLFSLADGERRRHQIITICTNFGLESIVQEMYQQWSNEYFPSDQPTKHGACVKTLPLDPIGHVDHIGQIGHLGHLGHVGHIGHIDPARALYYAIQASDIPRITRIIDDGVLKRYLSSKTTSNQLDKTILHVVEDNAIDPICPRLRFFFGFRRLQEQLGEDRVVDAARTLALLITAEPGPPQFIHLQLVHQYMGLCESEGSRHQHVQADPIDAPEQEASLHPPKPTISPASILADPAVLGRILSWSHGLPALEAASISRTAPPVMLNIAKDCRRALTRQAIRSFTNL